MSTNEAFIPPRATRTDGWTVERQLEFLEDLAKHGNVEQAAFAVGLSASSAYRLRGRDEAGPFAFGWRAAMNMAYYYVRDLTLERVRNGVTSAQHRDGVATIKTTFSDRLLLGLLNHLKPDARAVIAPGFATGDPTEPFAAIVDAYTAAAESGMEPTVPVPPAPPVIGSGPTFGRRVAYGPYRTPGKIYAPNPDEFWLECWPDGMTEEELAREDDYELELVGLAKRPETPTSV